MANWLPQFYYTYYGKCHKMVNMWLPWFNYNSHHDIFGFIYSETMIHFHKGCQVPLSQNKHLQLHTRVRSSCLGLFCSNKQLMFQSTCWTCSNSRKTDFKDTWTRRTENLFRECWGGTLCVKRWVDDGKAKKDFNEVKVRSG